MLRTSKRIQRDLEKGFEEGVEELEEFTGIKRDEGAKFILTSIFGFSVAMIGGQIFKNKKNLERKSPEHFVIGGLMCLTSPLIDKKYPNFSGMWLGTGFGILSHDFMDTIYQLCYNGQYHYDDFYIIPNNSPIDDLVKDMDIDKTYLVVIDE